MGWGQRYPQEQQAAQHTLISSSSAVSEALSHFVGWLLTVSGASFALLVSNIEKITPHVDSRSFKWSLIWFAISLLAGLLSRWLGTAVAGAIAAMSVVGERAARVGPIKGFSMLAFTKLFADGLLLPWRGLAWWSYRRTKLGDQISGIRPISYQSQAQALLTLAQLFTLFISVIVLANGINEIK